MYTAAFLDLLYNNGNFQKALYQVKSTNELELTVSLEKYFIVRI